MVVGSGSSNSLHVILVIVMVESVVIVFYHQFGRRLKMHGEKLCEEQGFKHVFGGS